MAPDQRHVIITGCSSGFGAGIVRHARAAGWQVHGTVRDLARPGEAASMGATDIGQPELLALDVTDPTSISAAAATILQRCNGQLDAVVHNAGIADAGFFEDQSEAAMRRVFETNFFGVTALTRAILPALRTRRRGRIVIMSSVSAFTANPAMGAYVASKRALEGWAECLALEVRPFALDVVLVEPGTYRTAIWDKATIARPASSPYAPYLDRYEAKVRKMVDRSAGDPDEVARRVVELLDAKKLRLRHPVGTDAVLGRLISGTIPFSWRARAITRWAGLR